MVVESDLKVFLSGIPDKTKKDVELEKFRKNILKLGDEDQGTVEPNRGFKIFNDRCTNEIAGNVDVNEKDSNIKDGNGKNDQVSDEDPVTRKRKRECYLGILNWLANIAKNPCNPAIGSMPEIQKWKNYGSEQMWKKVLLVREEMLVKRNNNETSQHAIWQKKQKMHPSMYEDHSVSESLRFSLRLLVAKDSSSKRRGLLCSESSSSGSQGDKRSDKNTDSTADSIGFVGNYAREKHVPIGPNFQVDIPKYTEAAYDSDSKWLGTRIWPLYKVEHKTSLIERDPIGKGRQESCGCQFPGSVECVRFHVGEKRKKVKLELGLAFYEWRFNSMGEEDANSWTKQDENKFQFIVNSNRLSSEKYFWDELFMCFPNKGREALVSYYFNVFVLQRRGQQNRNITSYIHSDDEESEFGPRCNRFGQMAAQSPGSIFLSPKKMNATRDRCCC
ncbi:AT-rich interactive domain-containing protein 1-like [Dorcoceras hygrometricum]|uniref:AT-rich interactive domain-containing protein 1-like n=1 Tax=Dorcoceras hygrometricum TaxID=472368 RepID=A0A2Z7BS47_9LAMI|nr:AT-rich interactive domain-containing protein 1-like [Dorcoceras hygrometricum]